MRNISIGMAPIMFCLLALSGCAKQVDSQPQVVKNTPTPKIAESKEKTLPEGTTERGPLKSVSPMSPDAPNPFALTKEEIEAGTDSILRDIRRETKRFAKAANFPDMEKQFLAKNEKDFRFWIIDAHTSLIGFVATRKNEENQVFRVVARDKIERRSLKETEIGSDRLWEYLESHKDIISTRDNRAIESSVDGESFAIELKTGKNYMFALYSDYDVYKGDTFLIDLCRIFSEDFGVEMCERKLLTK
jgi:hypothetical protein